MSDPTKPLHVQVAEALYYGRGRHSGRRHDLYENYLYENFSPHYDTDWGVTGPLVEKYKIWLNPGRDKGDKWLTASGDHTFEDSAKGATALEAICRIILKLGEAGKL